jgi:hypothetical protein
LNILCWDLLDLLTELCLPCICMWHGPDCRKHQILSLIVLINMHTAYNWSSWSKYKCYIV